MRKYYKNKKTGELKTEYGTISNGFIITNFSEEHGSPLANGCYQMFVTKEQLETEWEPHTFKFASDANVKRHLLAAWRTLAYQLTNHGMLESEKESFDYMDSEYNLLDKLFDRDRSKDYSDWWKSQERNFRDDDEFEYGNGASEYCSFLDSTYEIFMKFNVQTEVQ